MDNQKLIELAREAGIYTYPEWWHGVAKVSLERFAKLVRDATLEEAAGIALNAGFRSNGTPAYEHIAAAIRHLKEQQ